MAFCSSTGKLSELPFNSSSPSLILSRFSSSSSFNTLTHPFLSNSNSTPPFPTLVFSSLRTTHHSSPKPNPNTAPWLAKPSSPKRVSTEDPSHRQPDRPQNAVERIVLRLRNLGLTPEEEEQQQAKVSALPVTGEEKLSDLLSREWVRPDAMLVGDDDDEGMLLPWKRVEEEERGGVEEEGFKKRTVKAPSLAELTLEDELLRRLRREGMRVRERVSVPKAGLTQEVMDKIHERWRREELVRLKFHEELAKNMRLAHQLVEVSFLSYPLLCSAFMRLFN